MFRVAALSLVVVAAAALAAYSGFWRQGETAGQGAGPRMGGPFELVSTTGARISNTTLAGKPYLVFFGFTNCPDICPTTLYELTDLMEELGPVADRFQPLFITVDPERDTQDLMSEYMTAFDPRIIGLRGDRAATEAALKAFSAYARQVPIEGGGYTMDHTANVILMDGGGKSAGTLDLHEPRETVLAKLRRLADG